MLTPELATKIAQMYRDGAPDDHRELIDTLGSSEIMQELLAILAIECYKAGIRKDVWLAFASAALLVEIGYRMAKTEAMEEAFSK
jgi:hypothetical protein